MFCHKKGMYPYTVLVILQKVVNSHYDSRNKNLFLCHTNNEFPSVILNVRIAIIKVYDFLQ